MTYEVSCSVIGEVGYLRLFFGGKDNDAVIVLGIKGFHEVHHILNRDRVYCVDISVERVNAIGQCAEDCRTPCRVLLSVFGEHFYHIFLDRI